MLALCINLDDAQDRWNFTRSNFSSEGIPFQRVSAIVGKNLSFPLKECDATAYRLCHGKHVIPAEVGCYLSHLKAMHRFLESDESHALICEDDVTPVAGLAQLLERALRYQEHWDILRLSGFHNAAPQAIVRIDENYSLCVNLKYLGGTGAYLINRHAAQVLIDRLLPMYLPYDHALDREWLWGLKSLCIHPLPIDQGNHEFSTQIVTRNAKTAWYRRYWTVAPFRAKTQLMRFFCRSSELFRHRLRMASVTG